MGYAWLLLLLLLRHRGRGCIYLLLLLLLAEHGCSQHLQLLQHLERI